MVLIALFYKINSYWILLETKTTCFPYTKILYIKRLLKWDKYSEIKRQVLTSRPNVFLLFVVFWAYIVCCLKNQWRYHFIPFRSEPFRSIPFRFHSISLWLVLKEFEIFSSLQSFKSPLFWDHLSDFDYLRSWTIFFAHEIVCVKFYSIRLQRLLGTMVTKTDPHILKTLF